MTPWLQVSGKDMVRVLERHGFVVRSQKGSHVKLRGDSGQVVIVPLHRTLAPGTLMSVLAQAGVEFDTLKQWLGA